MYTEGDCTVMGEYITISEYYMYVKIEKNAETVCTTGISQFSLAKFHCKYLATEDIRVQSCRVHQMSKKYNAVYLRCEGCPP